jgi:autotransporter translocation and assembly factor TamB
MVGKFQYENGKLKINSLKAHGSPRQFEADFEIDLRAPSKATGSLSLINMPAQMLAQMAGVEGEYKGLVKARVTGFVGDGSALQGDFTVDGAGYGKLPLGQLRGEFTYSPAGIKLRRVRISGPTAEGTAEADIWPDGRYTLTGRLARLDLAAFGPPLKLTGLKGQCCAQVRASGAARAKRGTAQVMLGPGELQGQAFHTLTAALVFTPGKVEVKDLVLVAPAGSARGALTFAGLDQAREFSQLRGDLSFSQLAVAPLLPAGLASLVTSGVMNGSASLSGTLTSPVATAEVRGAGLVVTGRPVDTAFARASYRQGQFSIDEISMKTQDGQLALAGGYTQERGLDLALTGRELDLVSVAGELRERAGVSLRGTANITLALTGALAHPRADITAQAQGLTANSLLFDDLNLKGSYESGLVTVESFKLTRGEGSVEAAGRLALDGSTLDLTATAGKVNLGTLIAIGDSAVWRLYRGGKRYPFSGGTTAYRAL